VSAMTDGLGDSVYSGRLVEPDEGAHEDAERDLVASDVGIDGGAASAKEAAMHVVPDREHRARSGLLDLTSDDLPAQRPVLTDSDSPIEA
jgi:hypothetical protein